jgi:hypothetical protein
VINEVFAKFEKLFKEFYLKTKIFFDIQKSNTNTRMSSFEKTKCITLKMLLDDGYVSVGQVYRWRHARDFPAVINGDGSVSPLNNPTESFSASKYCENLCKEIRPKSDPSISGYNQGCVDTPKGSIPLNKLQNEYRIKYGIPLPKSNKNNKGLLKNHFTSNRNPQSQIEAFFQQRTNAVTQEAIEKQTQKLGELKNELVASRIENNENISKVMQRFEALERSQLEIVEKTEENSSKITKRFEALERSQFSIKRSLGTHDELQKAKAKISKYESRPYANDLKKSQLSKESYKSVSKLHDDVKILHREMYINGTKKCSIEYAETYSPVFYCFYLDCESLEVTKGLLNALSGMNVILIIVNRSESVGRMRKIIEEEEWKNVIIEAKECGSYLAHRNGLLRKPVVSAWFDGQTSFPNTLDWLAFGISNKIFFRKGTYIGITWCRARANGSGEDGFNDLDECTKDFENLLVSSGWDYEIDIKEPYQNKTMFIILATIWESKKRSTLAIENNMQ